VYSYCGPDGAVVAVVVVLEGTVVEAVVVEVLDVAGESPVV
jgi:hypothetical protein